ncbi:MAG: energy transducer TonB [Candidatus Nitricoxidivorans perseverans]|uniref:Energy transducer TonB n=1 Tax=Candidatus Nitricoxidivorans perseverans TaxID=2975601 RepID=A0AA49FJC0_9PROT|nr:MAG: energy transducer TonB [Candidatus Nitricoxidivorans perseverans]
MAPERAAGLLLVLALHGAALWGLWRHRLIPMQDKMSTLFVNIIEPERPPPKPPEPPKPKPPEPKPVEPPPQLVAQAPVVSPTEPVVPPPPPAPVIAAPPAPPAPPRPAGPVTLGGELSVSCPERTPPRYPPVSRRLGETGTVVLKVELDEQGQVARSTVATGSGFPRLDEAAQAAVQGWRCTPAHRDGRPVRAVALQPFKFVLE